MLKIPPWLSLAFKMHSAVIAAIIAAAQASPEHFGGTAVAGEIVFWGGFELTITNIIYGFVGTGAVPSQTLIGKVS